VLSGFVPEMRRLEQIAAAHHRKDALQIPASVSRHDVLLEHSQGAGTELTGQQGVDRCAVRGQSCEVDPLVDNRDADTMLGRDR
jgi:hypothetical protein